LADGLRLARAGRADQPVQPLSHHHRRCADPLHPQPGKGPKPIPIILSHGWPWTFWDFKDVILPLANPAAFGGDPADAFEVIVPSLPGYGFSTPLTKTGSTSPPLPTCGSR